MIRNRYRVESFSLYYLLMKARMHHTPYDPMPSRRETHIKWKARLHTNNKHTMGSEA